MKFSIVTAALFVSVVSAAPMRLKRAVDPALVPEFGHQAGLNPTGTGDCDGAVRGADGQPIKVPCSCPPERDAFIASLNRNVDAGFVVNNPSVPVTFPTGQSNQDKIARIQAALVTLQNLNDAGVGCPAASTTLLAQQKALQDAGNAAPAPPPAPAPAPEPAPAPAPAPVLEPAPNNGNNGGSVAALAPDFGFTAGRNPTGTGDCDGAVNGPDGRPIKVPCSCPPERGAFIAQLEANVAAGFVLNNPSVKVDFPFDDSPQSQSTRINAALFTLQNLNGPGKGCPAASTTLVAQQKALGL